MRVSVLTGAALCQVGEFSFVLLRAGRDAGLVADPLLEPLLVAVILSMLVTPFLLRLGPRLAAGVGRITPLTKLLEVDSLEDDHPEERLADHVVIAGYGLSGRELALALEHCGIPYLVLDLNVDNVRQAARDGVRAYFGDVTSAEVLEHVGIEHARELVLAVNDPDAAQRAVRLARHLSNDIRIVARTAYLVDAPRLLDAGANEVVTSELEAAVEIVHGILSGHGVDPETVETHLARMRARRSRSA
jgi:CPA2 family monovalent cation:H+ antiporter-2